jgi:hypothetical protein
MMSKTFAVLLFIAFFIVSAQAHAQENEVSFSLGGTFTPGSSTSQIANPAFCTIANPHCFVFFDRSHISSQVSFEGVYARRFMQTQVASFYFELPIVGVPSRTLSSSLSTFPPFGTFPSFETTVSRSDFSSVFITPSFRAKFLPEAVVSPFASIGEGLARFTIHSQSVVLNAAGGPAFRSTDSFTTNNLAFQFGGGLDFKTPVRNLGFRLEVRDFLTNRPRRFDFGSSDRRNNIFAGAGVVFHF